MSNTSLNSATASASVNLINQIQSTLNTMADQWLSDQIKIATLLYDLEQQGINEENITDEDYNKLKSEVSKTSLQEKKIYQFIEETTRSIHEESQLMQKAIIKLAQEIYNTKKDVFIKTTKISEKNSEWLDQIKDDNMSNPILNRAAVDLINEIKPTLHTMVDKWLSDKIELLKQYDINRKNITNEGSDKLGLLQLEMFLSEKKIDLFIKEATASIHEISKEEPESIQTVLHNLSNETYNIILITKNEEERKILLCLEEIDQRDSDSQDETESSEEYISSETDAPQCSGLDAPQYHSEDPQQ